MIDPGWEADYWWTRAHDYEEQLRELEKAARALLPLAECHCDEAWTMRGLHEPNQAHWDFGPEFEELKAVLATL